MVKQLARRVLPAAAMALVPLSADALQRVVSPSGPFTSIQSAIIVSQAGDSVLVSTGVYYERLVLRAGVHVKAATPGGAIVDAEGEGSAVTAISVTLPTSVTGLVFRNGSAVFGGGLYALGSSPAFTDCEFDANTAVLGGGAYLRDGSRATFLRCTFSNNFASGAGGGVYLDYSPASLSYCKMAGNQASDGGALSANNAAEATLFAATVYSNLARDGAVLASNDASPSYTNCTIAGNSAGVSVFGLRGSGTRIERCIVAFNTAPAFGCSGSAGPWIGCNILYANASNLVCAGDQGTNLELNPLFCSPLHFDFTLAQNSPAAGGTCGALGALGVACPAQSIETAVRASTWTGLKRLYR